ncbi:MAG: GntR family transcriptional regulator [Bacillota bacterium]
MIEIIEELTSARETLAERVADYLASEIISQRIKPGEQLVETELATRLRTSRAPIRDAFRLLELKGFVEVVPRKGTFVRKYTAKEIQDIYKVRASLEDLAVQLALPQLTANDFHHLDEAISSMKEALDVGNVKAYFDSNILFHQVFLDVSNNLVLKEIFSKLGRPLSGLRMTSLSMPNRLRESFEEHIKILEAVKKKDIVLARKLFEFHTLGALDKLKSVMIENV